MSSRDSYPAGVPCWVTVMQRDAAAGRDFYGPLFGWEFSGPMGPDPERPYFVATLDGDQVAGIGSLPPGVEPAWMTEVMVESAQEAADAAAAAGGTVLADPMDFAHFGRLAVVADPGGAAICAFESTGRGGVERVNEPGAWSMSTLTTPDTESAPAFYEAVFGWEGESFGPATMWRLPGYVGGEPNQPVPRDVVAVMAPGEAPAAWGPGFWVSDCDGAAAAAPGLGGRVLEEPHDIDMGAPFRTAVLEDAQGASFEISQLLIDKS